MKQKQQISGHITRQCLDELFEFSRALREGESREDVWVSVCRRWPLEEHTSDLGAAFGIYGDLSDTVSSALSAYCQKFSFYIYIPDQEIELLETGVLRLKTGDACTVLLSKNGQYHGPDQGELITFRATWNTPRLDQAP
jgi:hypothetical protein